MTDPFALADDTIKAAEEILDDVDNDDAQEFAESVKEKAESIRETMESMDKKGVGPTNRQTAALQNMLSGCKRWLENGRD